MKIRYILVLVLLMLAVLARPVIGEIDTNERIRQLEARIALLEAMVEVRDRRIVELQEQLEAPQDDAEPPVQKEVQEVSSDDPINDETETLDDNEEVDVETVLTVEDFYSLVKRYEAKGLTTAKRNAIVAEPVGSEFLVTARVISVTEDDAVIGGFIVKLVYESRATFSVVTGRDPDRRSGGRIYPGKVHRRRVPRRVVHIEVATQDRAVLDFLGGEELEVRGMITLLYFRSDEDKLVKRRVVFIRSSDCSFTCVEDE